VFKNILRQPTHSADPAFLSISLQLIMILVAKLLKTWLMMMVATKMMAKMIIRTNAKDHNFEILVKRKLACRRKMS